MITCIRWNQGQCRPRCGPEILIKDARPRIGHDIGRPGNRICSHGYATGHCFEKHKPKCIGPAGEDKYVRRSEMNGEVLPMLLSCENH